MEIKEELEMGLQTISGMVTRCNDLVHHVVGQRLNKAVDEAKKARITAENAMAEADIVDAIPCLLSKEVLQQFKLSS